MKIFFSKLKETNEITIRKMLRKLCATNEEINVIPAASTFWTKILIKMKVVNVYLAILITSHTFFFSALNK